VGIYLRVSAADLQSITRDIS